MKKKRALSLILALVLLATGVAACSQPAESVGSEQPPAQTQTPAEPGGEPTDISGTFEGTGYGMQGSIQVEIQVAAGLITDVSFLQISETPYVAGVAIERIPQQIVEYQSLGLDAVTGATLTSYGIMNAVADAAQRAGLDVDALRANKVVLQPGSAETWDTDVLVMGGGGAGFTAAITAAQEGAKVILIEKSSVLGGNSMVAGSAFNAVDLVAQSNMILTVAQKNTLDGYLAMQESDPALQFDTFPEWKEVLVALKEDINAFYSKNKGKKAGEDMPGFDSIAMHMWHIYIGGLRQLETGEWIASDVNLARTLTEQALQSFEWMGEVGMEPVYGEAAANGLSTVLGAMWPRTHDFLRGDARIVQLNSVALQNGVQVYTETAGTELILDNGRVTGAKAKKADGTEITINAAKGVVLATGGYCANPAMVKQYDSYWGADLSDRTLTTNMGTNKGDGIVMAEKIGAALTGMEIAQMMPSSSPTKGTMTDGIWGDASEQIWIDGEGNRFVNEYAERDVLAKSSLALENGVFYILYAGLGAAPDEMLKGASVDDVSYFGDRYGDLVDKGHVWYGDTLAELVEKSKTPAAGATPRFTEEALRKTIELYNGYYANQKDDDFGKEVIAGPIDIEYIENTPGAGYFITPRKSSLHHTMGGIKIDTQTRVLNTAGEPIEGLYAAGEVTGGIHAGNRLGGNAIADIFTFGRIAGRNAAN
ncbi:MAG: FAD-dependent oxidoreductase [Clostridiales bacterium]|nr:FAD-dependent oxidoreductase [Clostridiales bacterium]